MKLLQVNTRIPRTTHEYKSISKYRSQNPVQCTQYVQNVKCYRCNLPKLNLLCAYHNAVICSSRSARTGTPLCYPNMLREFPTVPVLVQFHCCSIFKSPTVPVWRYPVAPPLQSLITSPPTPSSPHLSLRWIDYPLPDCILCRCGG